MCRVEICWALTIVAMANAGPVTGLSSFHPVTVLLDFERPHSPVSLEALHRELDRIFAPAGFKIDIQVKSELAQDAEFGDLVLFKMKGSCTMNDLPIGALSDERGALAMTYSVDGALLKFGEVACDRVRFSIQRAVGRGNSPAQQSAYGKALARVMAHEIYHMLAQSPAHTKQGLTKESLSGRELLQENLSLTGSVQEAFRRTLHH